MHKKYAPDGDSNSFSEGADHTSKAFSGQIEISGKIVEEVGFEKIRRLLADLHELRIVLLDGMCIQGLLKSRTPWGAAWVEEIAKIEETCPNITELDMSLNLLESWQDWAAICSGLKKLKILALT